MSATPQRSASFTFRTCSGDSHRADAQLSFEANADFALLIYVDGHRDVGGVIHMSDAGTCDRLRRWFTSALVPSPNSTRPDPIVIDGVTVTDGQGDSQWPAFEFASDGKRSTLIFRDDCLDLVGTADDWCDWIAKHSTMPTEEAPHA